MVVVIRNYIEEEDDDVNGGDIRAIKISLPKLTNDSTRNHRKLLAAIQDFILQNSICAVHGSYVLMLDLSRFVKNNLPDNWTDAIGQQPPPLLTQSHYLEHAMYPAWHLPENTHRIRNQHLQETIVDLNQDQQDGTFPLFPDIRRVVNANGEEVPREIVGFTQVRAYTRNDLIGNLKTSVQAKVLPFINDTVNALVKLPNLVAIPKRRRKSRGGGRGRGRNGPGRGGHGGRGPGPGYQRPARRLTKAEKAILKKEILRQILEPRRRRDDAYIKSEVNVTEFHREVVTFHRNGLGAQGDEPINEAFIKARNLTTAARLRKWERFYVHFARCVILIERLENEYSKIQFKKRCVLPIYRAHRRNSIKVDSRVAFYILKYATSDEYGYVLPPSVDMPQSRHHITPAFYARVQHDIFHVGRIQTGNNKYVASHGVFMSTNGVSASILFRIDHDHDPENLAAINNVFPVGDEDDDEDDDPDFVPPANAEQDIPLEEPPLVASCDPGGTTQAFDLRDSVTGELVQTENIPNGRRDFTTRFYYHDSGINKSNKKTNCILQKPKIKAINDRRSMPGNHLKTMKYNNIKMAFSNYIFDYHDGWETMFNKRFGSMDERYHKSKTGCSTVI